MSRDSILPNPPAHDARLVQRAVAGDPEAFGQLYDVHLEPIYRFIFFRVGDTSAAEDLTSQVFLKAWEKLAQYEVRGLPFGAWLFRIARNVVIDHYRARRETVSLEVLEVERVAVVEGVAGEVEMKVDVERLMVLLTKLTDEQREVLTLRFMGGLTTEEIAQVMDKQPGAVRALQMRGLQALALLVDQLYGSV